MNKADDPLTDDDFEEDTKSLPLRSCYGSIGELSNNGSKKHEKKKQPEAAAGTGLVAANTAASPSNATITSNDNIPGDLKRSTSMNVTRADRGSKSSNKTITPNSTAVARLSKTSIEVDSLGWRLANLVYF